MADVVLFHSALGLRPAILAQAESLRAAGHSVTTPDLYAGAVFDDLDAGMAEKDRIGQQELSRRAAAAVHPLPGPAAGRVLIGWSLGAAYAIQLAGTLGAAGLVAIACEIWFDEDHPLTMPAQIHAAEGDEWIEEPMIAEAARRGVEVFRYRGGHLFGDAGLGDAYDADSADLLHQRLLAFLA